METAALKRALARALERQTATSDVLKVISRSSLDLEKVLDTLVATVARLCRADQAYMFGLRDDMYYMVAAHGLSKEAKEFIRSHPATPDRGTMSGRVSLERRPVQIPDVLQDPTYAYREGQRIAHFRTILGIPLLRGTDLIGLFIVGRTRVNPFTNDEIELATSFADQAAIAIENARLIAEIRQALDQQTATADVLQVINSSPSDLAPVFDAILEKAMRLCGTAFGALGIWTGDRFTWHAVRDPQRLVVDHMNRETWIGPRSGFSGIANSGGHVQFADISKSKFYLKGDPHTRAMVDVGGARSTLAVPLAKDGEAVGLLTFYRQEVRPFSEREIALVKNFAAQAVIAMDNARLLGELRRRTGELEESLRYQTATSDVLKVMSRSTFDLQPVLATVTETAARLCEAEMAFVSRREGNVFRYVTAVGSTPEAATTALELRRTFLDTHTFGPGRGTMTGRVLLERRPLQVPDIASDPEYTFPEAIKTAKIRTLLGVPLMREGEPIGVINLARQRVEPFTERQIELVRTFADQAVIAIENARLLTEQREALEQQTAAAEVLKVINASPGNLAPVFDAMLEKALHLCEAQFGYLATFDGERFLVVAGRGLPPALADLLKEPYIPEPGTASRRVIQGEPFVQIANLAEDEGSKQKNRVRWALLEIGGARSQLIVPLRKDDTLVGMLLIYRQETGEFSERQIALLQNFAAQAVIAMENARLINETREALEQQTATAEILRVINASPGKLEPVFDAILRQALRLCGVTHGVFVTYDGEQLKAVTTLGLSDVLAHTLRQPFRPQPNSPHAKLISERRVIHIPDLDAETQWDRNDPKRSGAADQGIRTMLFVPLCKDDTLLGYISANRREARAFSDKEIALMESFAAQAVIAIDNARLLDEIRQRQAELRVTFDNMGDGVAMFDAELRLTAWNRNFQQIMDLPDAILAKRPTWVEYVRILVERGEFGTDDVEGELNRRLAMAEPEMRLERTRPDGRVIEVRRNAVPGGGFVLIYGDITERKRAEAAIGAARDAAEAALSELKAAQANLIHSEKMASLGQLTAGIAHEIKNPLNFVNNFAGLSIELLEELKAAVAPAAGALNGDRRAEMDETFETLTGNLGKIAEHGRRADGIVKSMLAHSRGASGDRQSVDVNALIEESLNLAYHGARAQDQNFNVTLERDFDKALKPIELVPQDVTRVFLNLFGNGFYAVTKRRASAADPAFKPSLKVTTRERDGAVEIAIRDNGIGIPPEIRDRLFQPFFTTKPTGEGTGLGLSISYDIVTQQHGGTIAVDSRPGEFTEFTIRLPRGSMGRKGGR